MQDIPHHQYIQTEIVQYCQKVQTADPEKTAKFLETVIGKALRYDQALFVKSNIPVCVDYLHVKQSFKDVAQECFEAGYTVEELTEVARHVMVSDPAFKASSNFAAKIARYYDKRPALELDSSLSKQSYLEKFITEIQALEKNFVAVKSLSFSDGAIYKARDGSLVPFEYSEFRRAKKGIKGEDYVGYVKYLKRNWKSDNASADTVKAHEAFLIEILQGAGADEKVIGKIRNFESLSED
jgi:hypothetical protein